MVGEMVVEVLPDEKATSGRYAKDVAQQWLVPAS
jgi:hypothetical protein